MTASSIHIIWSFLYDIYTVSCFTDIFSNLSVYYCVEVHVLIIRRQEMIPLLYQW